MKSVIFLFTCLLFIGCGNAEKESSAEEDQTEMNRDTTNVQSRELETYSSEQWSFSMEYPAEYEVEEFQLSGEIPVINIYDPADGKSPPFAIHEDASLSYVALLPEGYGVDAPAGRQQTYAEYPENLPISFEVDENESMVYLMENGGVWAYSLRLENPPEGWGQYAAVFVHVRVNDFKAGCINRETEEPKPMADCDPLGSRDEVQYFGEIDSESEENLLTIIQNLKFG